MIFLCASEAPAAKPSEWFRRASLDLIGLPPTISEHEQSICEQWAALDATTSWLPVTQLTASSPTAEMSIVDVKGFAKFRATDNAKSKSIYTLDTTPPAALRSLSAFRLTYLPKNEKKSLTDAEWGASREHIKAEPLKLVDSTADEAHPLRDPTASLRTNVRAK